MTARVLIVDDLLPNVKLLEAKLTNEYFDVITAFNGQEALDAAASQSPDIMLLDVMMPGMDGYEVCRRMKADPQLMHIPVVMVTALSEVSDRVAGLECGADDFLTKPVNDVALVARVKSLVRLKMTIDEWRRREETCDQFGVIPADESAAGMEATGARVLVVDKQEIIGAKIKDVLAADKHEFFLSTGQEEALGLALENPFDLIIVGAIPESEGGDSLRLCSMLRSRDETRNVPILILIEDDDMDFLAKALELGVNNYLVKPVEPSELLARSRGQIRRKRYQDCLRDNYERSLSMALTDSLTGLYNRRYANAHLSTTLQRSKEDGRPIAILMIDIDHFKQVNDTHGHAVGDEVLREISSRIIHCVRSFDMVARMGGEEFIVVLPDAPTEIVLSVAERLRSVMADNPFKISDPKIGELTVTISIGAVLARPGEDTPEDLMRFADEVLYAAKGEGRNRVVSAFESEFRPAGKSAAG